MHCDCAKRVVTTAIVPSGICPLLLVLFLLASPGGVAAQADAVPAKFEIPHLPVAATRDGTIDAAEWSRASAMTGGVAVRPARSKIEFDFAERQAVFWLGRDEEALYLAARSWHRPDATAQFGHDGSNDNVELGGLPHKAEQLRYPCRLFIGGDKVGTSDIVDMRAKREAPR